MTRSLHGLIVVVAAVIGCPKDDIEEIPAVESEIGWVALAALDVESGARPESLTEQLAHPVRIHGYAVPLELAETGVTSFLLVPDASYCMHVPPPPPNQLILVEVETPLHWRLLEGGMWLTGTVFIAEEKSEFGGFMYKMKDLTSLEGTDW